MFYTPFQGFGSEPGRTRDRVKREEKRRTRSVQISNPVHKVAAEYVYISLATIGPILGGTLEIKSSDRKFLVFTVSPVYNSAHQATQNMEQCCLS